MMIVFLGICISTVCGVPIDINFHIIKARSVYVKLGHLWRHLVVSLVVKGRVSNALVKAVLLYPC